MTTTLDPVKAFSGIVIEDPNNPVLRKAGLQVLTDKFTKWYLSEGGDV